MERNEAAQGGRVLAVMRTARGWTSKRLAEALSVRPGTYYAYESGAVNPSRELLERAAVAMGHSPALVERTFVFLRSLDGPEGGDEIDRQIHELAAELGAKLEGGVRTMFGRVRLRARAVEARQWAPGLWERLAPLPRAERRRLVREDRIFQSWGLAEHLCRLSIAAAPDSADRAIELAELAVLVAGLIPGERAWRARVQGFAQAHLGNAWRVKTELNRADEAFRRAKDLWQAGAGGDPEGFLSEAVVLGMEASLRHGQRRLAESLSLLDRALTLADGSQGARLLNKKARTLEELGEFGAALATIEVALGLADEREVDLVWGLRFNLLVNLCHLGRQAEAEALLPELRELGLDRGNELDLLRLGWLEGRVAAGVGRTADAEAAFERVRQGFVARGIPYDAALASLDLAILWLEQGRVDEVAALALEMERIFRSQGVDREGLAAFKLFCDAAAARTLTLEAARRCRREIEQAAGVHRVGPGLGRRPRGRG